MIYSIEAQQAVLGSIIIDGTIGMDCMDILSHTHFYGERDALIYHAIEAMNQKGVAIDVVSLSTEIADRGNLELCGGISYLVELANNTPSATNWRHYAEIVLKTSHNRELLAAAKKAAQLSESGIGNIEANIDSIVADLQSIGSNKQEDFVAYSDLIKQSLERLDARFNGTANTGYKYGLTDLDLKLIGNEPTDLITIAGRPGMGKTTCAMNIIDNMLIANESYAAYVGSFEMPASQIVERQISEFGRLKTNKIKDSKSNMRDDDWQKLSAGIAKMKTISDRIIIDDKPSPDISYVIRSIKRAHREFEKNGHKMVVAMVDHLGKITDDSVKTHEPRILITSIIRKLNHVAKTLGIQIFALSQLNRGVEQRPNKRPIMSDLKESGSIEEESSVVLFVYRDEYYNEDSPDKGVAEIIIGKNRHGETGTVRVACDLSVSRFSNLAPDIYNENYQ